MRYILAMDQGTGSSRCILYDRRVNPVAPARQTLTQHFPHPGWVEYDAEEIWSAQSGVFHQVLAQAQPQPADIAGIGITNQRETTVIWERSTGKPIYNAIVWRDRRTTDGCVRLKQAGFEPMVKAKTGLLRDAYFSATKSVGCWIMSRARVGKPKWRIDQSFNEKMPPLEVKSLKRHWLKAVARTKNWAE